MKEKSFLLVVLLFISYVSAYSQRLLIATDTLVLEVGLGDNLTLEKGKNGFWDYYYDNNPGSQLKFKAFFKDDTLNGELIGYWPNGIKKVNLNLIDGKKTGPAHYYDNRGNLKYKLNYKNDLLDGEVIEYYKNGRIKRNLKLQGGRLNGISKAFEDTPENRLIAEGGFKKGLRSGTYKSYATKKQSIIEYFEDDHPVGNKEIWLKDKLIGEFVLDTLNYRFTKIVSYKNGKLDSEQEIDINSPLATDFIYGSYLYLPKNFR
jgi:hypothetical protein